MKPHAFNIFLWYIDFCPGQPMVSQVIPGYPGIPQGTPEYPGVTPRELLRYIRVPWGTPLGIPGYLGVLCVYNSFNHFLWHDYKFMQCIEFLETEARAPWEETSK